MKTSDYVFGAALSAVALSGVPGLLESKAHAAVVAGFTFETDYPATFPSGVSSQSNSSASSSTSFVTYAGYTGASVGPLLAEIGSGSAYGVHAATNTVYTTPVGNGSPRSLSSNRWTSAGDYYQFVVPTTGYEDILLSFDTVRSGTGPAAFVLSYSTDGTNFSTFANYSVASTPSFNVSSSSTAVSQGFDLSALTAVDNVAALTIRLANETAVVSTATGGSVRVDNFFVNGTAIPEPASLAVVGLAGAAAIVRRRKA